MRFSALRYRIGLRPSGMTAPPQSDAVPRREEADGRPFIHRLRRAYLFRRHRGPLAEFSERAIDPKPSQLLRQAVLAKPLVQGREIHAVERLVLVEAGEDHCSRSRHRIDLRL